MRFTSLVLLSCLLSVAAFVGQVHGQEQVNACAQACIRRGPGRQCDSLTDPNCICGEGKTISSCIASNCGSQQEAWSSLSASICGLATPTSSVTFTGPPFSFNSTTTLPITAPTPSPPVSSGSSALSLPTSSGSNTATLLPTTGTSTALSSSGTGTATGADASQTSNAARAMQLNGSWHLGTVFGVGVVGAALGGTLALL